MKNVSDAPLVVRVPLEVRERLRRIAELDDTSVSQFVRRAIRAALAVREMDQRP